MTTTNLTAPPLPIVAAAKPSPGIVVRGVDRPMAIFTTFAPPLFALTAISLHATGVHRVTIVDVVVLAIMHCACVAGVELGFHRLFAHDSFRPSLAAKLAFAVVGTMAMQGPLIWWVSIHRRHHAHSDTENDPHTMYRASPRFTWRGLAHGFVGWTWDPSCLRVPDGSRIVLDLYRDRLLFRVHMNYLAIAAAGFVVPALAAALAYFVVDGDALTGLACGALFGGGVRLFTVNHLTFGVLNTVPHGLCGTRRFTTRDHTTNVRFLVVPTLGQSLHNNHHARPAFARTSCGDGEIDPGFAVLRVLAALHLVHDLRIPATTTKESR